MPREQKTHRAAAGALTMRAFNTLMDLLYRNSTAERECGRTWEQCEEEFVSFPNRVIRWMVLGELTARFPDHSWRGGALSEDCTEYHALATLKNCGPSTCIEICHLFRFKVPGRQLPKKLPPETDDPESYIDDAPSGGPP